MSLVGSRVRNFRIEKLLGKGGMGEVYVAFDETLERRVALKSIRAEHRLSPQAKARFLREARILSKLDNPGICRIYDYVDGENDDFLVLELIEGATLLAASRDLDPARKLEVAEQIARVFVAAHAEGVVHRDLKPDNVMLTDEGAVKVLDFGLARSEDSLTSEVAETRARRESPDSRALPEHTVTLASDHTALGRVIGTPFYMSPEQARGEPVTPASDMYSLGLTLHSLFTGKMAYDRPRDMAELLQMAREGRTLPIAGVDSDLAALIERLKSSRRTARPTAVETLERLRWIRRKPVRRRRRWIAAALSIVVLAAGLKYTLDLRRERREADHRRAQAEDLIEFMLGDLREKLEPVGRLDVLEDVGDKALEYFASLRGAELSGEEQFRLSKAMSQIGEVRVAQGDLGAAMDAFRESLTIAEDLVGREPWNGEWKVGLGAAYFWVGSVHYAQGDLDGAERRFRDYLRVSTELAQSDPSNEDWQLELGYAHTNLAAIHDERGELEEALGELSASVEIKRRLVAAAPDDAERQRSLANSLDWLSVVLDSRGDLEGALQARRSALTIRHAELERDPRDMDALRMLGLAESMVGSTLEQLGRDSEALVHFRADLEIGRRLAVRDPDNADWRRDLEISELSLGTLLLRLGSIEEAGTLLRSALVRAEALADLDPSIKDWQEDLTDCRFGVARLQLARDRPEQARFEVERALDTLRPLLRDGPDDSSVIRRVGTAHLPRGQALNRSGRPDLARAAWTEALEQAASAGLSEDEDLLAVRARALIRLGRLDEARELARRLGAKGYAATEFVRLCRDHGIEPEAPAPPKMAEPPGEAENLDKVITASSPARDTTN